MVRQETTVSPHRFEECPSCGSELYYPTRSDVVCQNCDDEFCHEIRADRHLLWSFTDDYRLNEVVARVE